MILECLVAAMFFEARDQTPDAQMAVAEVILNRVEHEDFPNDVCGVVYEDRQFSFTHDGMSDDPETYTRHDDAEALEEIRVIAQDLLTDGGKGLGITSTHYHATYVRPFWVDVYDLDGRIGDHLFYTCDGNKRNC